MRAGLSMAGSRFWSTAPRREQGSCRGLRGDSSRGRSPSNWVFVLLLACAQYALAHVLTHICSKLLRENLCTSIALQVIWGRRAHKARGSAVPPHVKTLLGLPARGELGGVLIRKLLHPRRGGTTCCFVRTHSPPTIRSCTRAWPACYCACFDRRTQQLLELDGLNLDRIIFRDLEEA